MSRSDYIQAYLKEQGRSHNEYVVSLHLKVLAERLVFSTPGLDIDTFISRYLHAYCWHRQGNMNAEAARYLALTVAWHEAFINKETST